MFTYLPFTVYTMCAGVLWQKSRLVCPFSLLEKFANHSTVYPHSCHLQCTVYHVRWGFMAEEQSCVPFHC
jgi:hypothetical protein